MAFAWLVRLQTGRYKDWRGPAGCLQCPDVNMLTKCSNLTGCTKRYPDATDLASQFVRNSLQLCWCKPGFFRVAMIYRYVPFKSSDKKCTKDGNFGWIDVYDSGRERPLECRPTEEPYEFCYKENSANPDVRALEIEDKLCSTCDPDMECGEDLDPQDGECAKGACCQSTTCLQYESMDRGKVWAEIQDRVNENDASAPASDPVAEQSLEDGATICLECPITEACEGVQQNKVALDDEDNEELVAEMEACGCLGDGFGLGPPLSLPPSRPLLPLVVLSP